VKLSTTGPFSVSTNVDTSVYKPLTGCRMRRKPLIIAYQGKVSACNIKVLVARLANKSRAISVIVTMPSRQPWHCRLESIHSVIGTVELKRAFPMGRTDAFTYPPYSQEHPLNVWFQRGGTSPRGHLRYYDVHTLGTRGLLTSAAFPSESPATPVLEISKIPSSC
jgi:hypothetical protein